jgi:hypothetical protein
VRIEDQTIEILLFTTCDNHTFLTVSLGKESKSICASSLPLSSLFGSKSCRENSIIVNNNNNNTRTRGGGDEIDAPSPAISRQKRQNHHP